MGTIDCRVEKWHKICDFIADKEIPFRECSDGIYRPDFEKITNGDKRMKDKMEDKYMEAFGDYMEFCNTVFK